MVSPIVQEKLIIVKELVTAHVYPASFEVVYYQCLDGICGSLDLNVRTISMDLVSSQVLRKLVTPSFSSDQLYRIPEKY